MDKLLEKLEYRRVADGKYMARCPAHNDSSPSLSITRKSDRILIHCHAGCGAMEVLEAIGLTFDDLFDDLPEPVHHRRRHRDEYEKMLIELVEMDLNAGKKILETDREAYLRAKVKALRQG